MPQGLAQIRRVAIIAALCAIAAIGLQARAALPTAASGVVAGAAGQAFADITAAVTGASLVAGIVLFVLMSRYRKLKPKSQSAPMPWWARMLAILLMLAVIGGPLVLLIRAWSRRGRRAVHPVLPPALGHAGRTLGSNTSSGWALFAGMAFAAAALIIAALWVRRQRRVLDGADDSRAEPQSKPSLQDALSAGSAALRDETDPRAAIIACYAAMETSLAGAGAAPTASDTPDEVLARAASGGLIRSAAAGELTGLFRQARYGHRDMAEGERATAQGALTRLRADLGGTG